MKKIITADGSETFHNPEYDDIYHSRTGAVEEALLKFVRPCRVGEQAAKTGRIRILDICFGLGYNSAAALEEIGRAATGARVEIVALEKDPRILALTREVNPPLAHYGLIRELASSPQGQTCSGEIRLRLIQGRAEENIRDLDVLFQAVFHDPFSPPKNPELWTAGFFGRVRSLTDKGGVLATYSCARQIRDNLRSVGFRIKDGPRVGRRGPGTLAYR